MPTLSFHGAAGTVTGSCHLIEFEDQKIVLDAGEFQGPWAIEHLNYKPFAFKPDEIDALLLSHGHLDHCGRIPALAKQGFQGKIYCTHPTRDIAQLIMMDSAHILKEEFAWRRKRLLRTGINAEEPLYSFEDVFYASRLFAPPVGYHEKVDLNSGRSLFFHNADAGHILGSSQIYLDYKDKKGEPRRLLYTGDLGDGDHPIVNDPERPQTPVDVLIIESTYGNREHKTYQESIIEFEEAVISTIKKKGAVLIPTFALERAQELLFHIGRMKMAGKIPGSLPVFLNSPLAINITRLYAKNCGYCNRDLDYRMDPFSFPGLIMTESAEESRAIHSVEGPKIILAGSGMMTGGRIKHHLKHLLWMENTTLIIVGYQAEGTLGRKIINGDEMVKIFGAPVSVKAKVCTINGFSAHAGKKNLLEFAKRTKAKKIFVVHGEPEASETLAQGLKKIMPAAKVHTPVMGQKFQI